MKIFRALLSIVLCFVAVGCTNVTAPTGSNIYLSPGDKTVVAGLPVLMYELNNVADCFAAAIGSLTKEEVVRLQQRVIWSVGFEDNKTSFRFVSWVHDQNSPCVIFVTPAKPTDGKPILVQVTFDKQMTWTSKLTIE